jgi:hypothetical protein
MSMSVVPPVSAPRVGWGTTWVASGGASIGGRR